MSQIIKAYLGILLLLLLTFSTASVFSAYLTVMDAQDIHQKMINELENSDYYRPVIADCFQTADRRAYELVITLYKSDYTSVVCHSEAEIPESTDEVMYAGVALNFDLGIPFWNLLWQKQLFAYAR